MLFAYNKEKEIQPITQLAKFDVIEPQLYLVKSFWIHSKLYV